MAGVSDSRRNGPGPLFISNGQDEADQQAREDGNGMLFMFGENSRPTSVKDVEDGTSNTLFVGEVTSGQGLHPQAGFAWIGHMWAKWNTQSTILGINGIGSIPGGRDDSIDPLDGDGGNRHGEYWREVGFSSYHPGGAHFLYVDGSVHFLSENIDQFLLAALTTRAGTEVINEP